MYKFKSKVWLYPGMSGWHFISVPAKLSKNITATYGDMKKGWGSLPVNVTVGKSSWKTSIFPDKKTNTYLLPLKSEIRKKENISAESLVSVQIDIKI